MPKTTFEKLKEKVLEIEHISSAIGLLDWDTNVYMPPKSSAFRGQTLATLSALVHEKFLDKNFEKLLMVLKKDFDDNKLPEDQRVFVREIYRTFKKEKKLPSEFVKELSQAVSEGHHLWVEARKTNDFNLFAPQLSKIVDLKRQQARYIGYAASPYDVLLDDFEPGLTSEQASAIFYELKKFLVPFIQKIVGKNKNFDQSLLSGKFDPTKQKELMHIVAAKLGYDLEAGRIDETAHPFMSGMNPYDTRVTTHYLEDNFYFAFGSTVHEVGHALYEQGLLPEHFGTPLGTSVSLGIHESQSRLWENLVGKRLAFWKYFFPVVQEYFPEKYNKGNVDDFYQALNQVQPSLIRIKSDEVTYNMHIIIRFEIEKELIEGSIDVRDLPIIWNSKHKEYLNIDVPNDAQGVLQDVHWSSGLFGYFPTYTLGNLYSAQFFQQAKKEIVNLDELFEKGQFLPLREWLRKAIHQHGKLYTAAELCQKVTGEALNSKYYTQYLEEKFGQLYKL